MIECKDMVENIPAFSPICGWRATYRAEVASFLAMPWWKKRYEKFLLLPPFVEQ